MLAMEDNNQLVLLITSLLARIWHHHTLNTCYPGYIQADLLVMHNNADIVVWKIPNISNMVVQILLTEKNSW